MANKNVEMINPGYTALWTDDKAVMANSNRTGEAGNLLNGNNADALVEGEWLTMDSETGKFMRDGDATTTPVGTGAGAKTGLGLLPSYMYFYEQGNPTPDTIGLGHVIVGPVGFVFKAKFGNFGAAAAGAFGKRVYVLDITHDGGVKRGLHISSVIVADSTITTFNEGVALADTQVFSPGYIKRWINANTAEIMYSPEFINVELA